MGDRVLCGESENCLRRRIGRFVVEGKRRGQKGSTERSRCWCWEERMDRYVRPLGMGGDWSVSRGLSTWGGVRSISYR